MKGLRKFLAPFAPDHSGAVAVLFEMGGIIVICDAGGCSGNICGFDEPRWFTKKSAVFSAGLRDMDAILGRDDKLVEKLAKAGEKIEAKFAAVIGTPVPAVIATDYHAIRRMAEKKMNMPVLTVNTTGMVLYDEGAEKAFLEVFKRFTDKENTETVRGRVGIIGATPLDTTDLHIQKKIENPLKKEGYNEVFCYGMGSGLDKVSLAATVEKNIVISPCGLKSAVYLKEKFNVPYEIKYPLIKELFEKEVENNWKEYEGKKILIVHQQVMADTIRKEIKKAVNADVTAASWFMMKKELKEENDISLKEEDQWIELVNNGDYDIIIGDEILKKAVPKFKGVYRCLPHFAVSGKL